MNIHLIEPAKSLLLTMNTPLKIVDYAGTGTDKIFSIGHPTEEE